MQSISDRADMNLSPIESAKTRSATQLQANANRADENLSPVASSRARDTIQSASKLKSKLSNEDKIALSNPSKPKDNRAANYDSEPPVIRDIHRGLDNFAKTKASKFISDAGMALYTPGAAANVVASATQGAGNLIGKLLPGLGKTLGGKVAKVAATEAIAGAPLGVGNELARNPEATPNEMLTAGAFGAGGGAILGGAGTLAKAGIQKGVQSVGITLKGVRGNQMQAIDSAMQSGLPTSPRRLNAQDVKVPAGVPKMQGNTFTNLFGNQGVGITPTGGAIRPLTTESQIVKKAIKNDESLWQGAKARARAVYQNTVDQLSPLKKVPGAYDTAMDATRANNIANTIVHDKFVTPEGNVVGDGLSTIFKKVARGQDSQFVDYLTLRHAKTRMARNENVYDPAIAHAPKTPDDVQARIDMYDKRHPEFAAIAKEWDNFNDNVLKTFGVNEGLISEAQYKALREQNPNYSPMRRQFSRSEKPGRNFIAKTTKASFSGQSAPIKEVSPTGSIRKIVDPRKTTVEAVGAWSNAAMRNRVMQNIAEAVRSNPEAFKGVIEIKPLAEQAKQTSVNEMNKMISEHGIEGMLDSLNKDFELLFKKYPNQGLNEENVVRAMIKGQPVHLQIHDPELVKTLIGMGPQASNILLDTLTMFSNGVKRGATGALAPFFAVKGATMDLVQSAIQASNPPKQAAYTVYAILSGIGDKLRIPGLRNLAEEYRLAGGEFSNALKGDRQLNRSISDMTRDPLLSPRAIGKGLRRTMAAPFKALESVGDVMENAPRAAAYRIKMNQLGGAKTPENVRTAMGAARESTVNWARKGAMTRDFEAFIPYNNAAIQGTYRIIKGLKNNPVKTAASIAALAVMPKLYEYAQFHNDPDYQKIPARERYRYFIHSKNADGTFNKIPMEPAYNSFGEMAIEVMRHYMDKDPNAFQGAADALSNVWLPPAVTGAAQGITQGAGLEGSLDGALNATTLAPFSAIQSNKSFTGAPIVSQRLQGNSPGQQYDERTSDPAKWLGDKLGMSPLKVDYLLRSYGGDPARLVLPLMSDVGAGTPRNTLLKNFIVDPVFTNTLSNDFYNMKQKITQAESDNNTNGVAMPSWYNQDVADYATSQKKGGLSKTLSGLNTEKRDIQADKTLSAEDKAQKLRDVQSQINKLYLEAITKMRDGGVSGEQKW